MGDCQTEPLRLQFDCRLRLEFHGANVTSDAGILAYRELDHALQLTDTAADVLHETRTGRNTRHGLTALLRQSLFSRLTAQSGFSARRLTRNRPSPTQPVQMVNTIQPTALPWVRRHAAAM